ncbi:MAG: hypothetical protein V9G24_07205 [Rhodoblastus sp.]
MSATGSVNRSAASFSAGMLRARETPSSIAPPSTMIPVGATLEIWLWESVFERAREKAAGRRQ